MLSRTATVKQHRTCDQRDPMMIIQPAWQLSLDFFAPQTIVIEPSAGQISSDAGLLPFRQLDEHFGLTRQFAEALHLRPAHTALAA